MSFPQILENYRQRAEAALEEQFKTIEGPPQLLEAMNYSLMAGGKRVRAIMLLAARELFAFKEGDPRPEPAACALEFIHTYSLIHDDLPAMDNDDFRRGKPSCHKAFGEALAILAGDALLTEAFGLVARSMLGQNSTLCAYVLTELAYAAGAGGMVGGQVIDTLETGKNITREPLETMHSLKTGALLLAPVKIGALMGGADEKEMSALIAYGRKTGLAFQVVDDYLDVIADEKELGKSKGKDAAQGKTTFVTLMGVEGARDYARTLTQEAIQAIEIFRGRAEALRELAAFISSRTY